MKKLIATLSLALVVTLGAVGCFVGCKNNGIVGTWKFSEIVIDADAALAAGMSQDTLESTKAEMEKTFKGTKYTFKKGGKGTAKSALMTMNIEWKQEDNKITIVLAGFGEGVESDSVYTLDGNKLTTEVMPGFTVIYKK